MTENPDLRAARNALGENATLAFVKGDRLVKFEGSGIGDLYREVCAGKSYAGYSAADKIVGRAAAFLFVKLGVDGLYAATISSGAVEILEKYGIDCSFGVLTPNIINRLGTGKCPMEEAVSDARNPDKATEAIGAKLKELRAEGK